MVSVTGKGRTKILSGVRFGDERKRTTDDVSKACMVTSKVGLQNRPMKSSRVIWLLLEWCPA